MPATSRAPGRSGHRKRRESLYSVMLEPADALDVIPRIRPMAQEALVDLCVLLAGDTFVHHLEVHHVVAWRRLMALRAVLGSRRGVQEPCNSPTGGLMTVAAFPAEQIPMRLAVAVTACAIQPVLFGQP